MRTIWYKFSFYSFGSMLAKHWDNVRQQIYRTLRIACSSEAPAYKYLCFHLTQQKVVGWEDEGQWEAVPGWRICHNSNLRLSRVDYALSQSTAFQTCTRELVKMQTSNSAGLGGAWGSAFLTGSQVILLLLVQRSHWE